MRNWLQSKQAAWGESLVLLALGGLATYLNAKIGIPILVVLLGFGIWLIISANKRELIQQGQKLENIVPILEQMDSTLREQVLKELKKSFNKEYYIQLNIKINEEIFGIKLGNADNPEIARRQVQSYQSKMVNDYGNKGKDKWFENADIISGLLDDKGFGLKSFRKRRRYQSLVKKLDKSRNEVIDDELNDLIKKHLFKSETLNNMVLFKERSINIHDEYKGKKYAITDFLHSVLVASLNRFEMEAKEYLVKIRLDIGKRINYLEAQYGNDIPIKSK